MLSRIQDSSVYKILKKLLPSERIHYPNHQRPPDLTNDINNQILEFLDMTDSLDNASRFNTTPGEPTYSVVEIAHPHIATPPPPSEKMTEEPDSESQQRQNKQEDIPTPKAEDSQSAAKVSNVGTKYKSGDIGSCDCSTQKEIAKPKPSDITEQAGLPCTPFTPQIFQTNNSEHTSSHQGMVEVEVDDQ